MALRLLGISAFYHDSAAALLVDGRIVAAAQEERFSRKKHDPRFPANAIAYCLAAGNIDAAELDGVVFYEKPFLKFERLLETYLAFAPRGIASFARSMPLWIKEKLFQKSLLAEELSRFGGSKKEWEAKLLFSEHHLSHAASAFYPGPFKEAVVLTMDGVGEWPTSSVAIGSGDGLEIKKELAFPHSLGLLYSAFTYYCGFKVNSGEYKLMGLAPYGTPRYRDLILKHLVEVKADGSFRLAMNYFNYATGLTMTSRAFHAMFGGPPRGEGEELTQRHMDLASSIQAVTEEIVLSMAKALRAEYGIANLCLAGGVALNCVANGKLEQSGIFDNIWVQPAAGDAGGAPGAALAAYHLHYKQPRLTFEDSMQGGYLGPSFTDDDIAQRLDGLGAVYERLSEDALLDATAKALAEGNAIGWFQGRMEFGPRALGNRSILADPRNRDMQTALNLKVKFRESFRPFAPAVLKEEAGKWFALKGESPYMLNVQPVLPEHRLPPQPGEEALFGIERLKIARSAIPAVTHVDYSARIQTVSRETNPRFHALLTRFKERTGCPLLVNTSFNVRGEPIVGTPEDAYRCFMGTGLDMLAIGNCLLRKAAQPEARKTQYHEAFELD